MHAACFTSSLVFLALKTASTKNASKIIPDLVLIAIHLSGSNGADCALDGADHIVDFKTLQGLSLYNNTSTTPGATLDRGGS